MMHGIPTLLACCFCDPVKWERRSNLGGLSEVDTWCCDLCGCFRSSNTMPLSTSSWCLYLCLLRCGRFKRPRDHTVHPLRETSFSTSLHTHVQLLSRGPGLVPTLEFLRGRQRPTSSPSPDLLHFTLSLGPSPPVNHPHRGPGLVEECPRLP